MCTVKDVGSRSRTSSYLVFKSMCTHPHTLKKGCTTLYQTKRKHVKMRGNGTHINSVPFQMFYVSYDVLNEKLDLSRSVEMRKLKDLFHNSLKNSKKSPKVGKYSYILFLMWLWSH